MITDKKITFTTYGNLQGAIDEIFLEIAEEIKKGYTVQSVTHECDSMCAYTKMKQSVTIELHMNKNGRS